MGDQTPSNVVEDFEAGKKVFEALKDLPRERQERVLRWVSESLDIALPSNTASATPAGTAPPARDVPVPAPPSPATSSHSDIASFVAAKKPRSDVQFAAVVAHYYKFEAPHAERRETINADVVRDATRLANWERIGTPKHTLNNAMSRGYLNRRSPGEFAISTVGENLVARTLPAEGARTGKKPGPKPKSAKKRAASKERR